MKNSGATEYLREHVIDAGLCTNCGACVNLCPYFIFHKDRIVVRDVCSRADGGCLDVCPRLPTDLQELNRLFFDEKDMTAEAGAIKAFYVTRAADPNVRRNAQHGGTVTALVNLALSEGLIDAAVLSGGNSLLPSGVTVTRAGEAGKLSKSRFVVSPNVAAFNKLAKGEARSIGIVATPCQALALAKMRICRDPKVRENANKLRLVIGLFCGWAFHSAALKDLLEGKIKDIDSIIGMDIPPSEYHALDVFTAEGKLVISLDEVQKCIRPSCNYCSDMTAEFSDISVGSARLPEGWEEAKSWNQVIVRSATGEKLMSLAQGKGVLEFREAPEHNLEKLKKASLKKKAAGAKKLKEMGAGKAL